MKIRKTILSMSLFAALTSCVGSYDKDASMTRKIKDVLYQNHVLHSREIYVKTLDGEVTLSGFVNTPREIILAQQEALTVENVQVVHNKLVVRRSAIKNNPKEIAEDIAITEKIKLALVNHPDLNAYQIKASTHKSIVYLNGVVPSRAEALKAESLALDVKGVQGVKNQLKIQQ